MEGWGPKIHPHKLVMRNSRTSTMKKKSVLTIIFILTLSSMFGQITIPDSLTFEDPVAKAKIIVNKSDYLTEINSIFQDSLKYSVTKYINLLSENSFIERNYFVNLHYYNRTLHPKYFDKALLNLFQKNKLKVTKNGGYLKTSDIKTKVIRVYRCPKTAHIYCGKDWGLFYNNELLTSFEKSRNRQTYRMIDCF